MYDPRQNLIVALDVSSAAAAQKIVAAVGDSALTYKVGMQLYTAEGPSVVRDLVASGRRVFLDLKYHDIPNTVAGACRAAAKLGVSIMNVHAQGGAAMMRAAVEAAKTVAPATKVIAVTMLTSLSDEDFPVLGLTPPVADQVLRLATLAQQCGLDGVVCSAHEIVRLRNELGPDFLLVVPGIRPAGSALDDQRRVMGPAEARDAGANILVIGRPITDAPDAGQAARDIAQSLGISVA